MKLIENRLAACVFSIAAGLSLGLTLLPTAHAQTTQIPMRDFFKKPTGIRASDFTRRQIFVLASTL
jgi:hypothetical protein